jgi:ENTH domain
MGVVARRLQDTGELWRHVYKSLLLLEYMLKHGPQKVGSVRSNTLR